MASPFGTRVENLPALSVTAGVRRTARTVPFLDMPNFTLAN